MSSLSGNQKKKKEVRQKGKRSKNNSSSDDIDKMKARAAKNNMFVYIKIPQVPLLVSYKGEKEKNLEDVENFELQFPVVEYHDRNWTWLDLALAVKQRSKRLLFQQFMKAYVLKGGRRGTSGSGGRENESVASMAEEEKAKLLLGSKLLTGTPEKSSLPSVLFKKK